jgi:hypothetical protein
MDFSCFGASGGAFGSALAAAVMARSCSTLGIATEGRLDTLDIVLDLTTSGLAQTDDSLHFATFNKGHVVQGLGLRRERDHAQLAILKAGVDPGQRGIPVEFASQGQRYAMPDLVLCVFRRIELDLHTLM